MGLFGEPPRHIDRLKRMVKARDETHELRIDQAFVAYDAALDEVETVARRELDVHVMMQQAALQELTNRGEDVAASGTNAPPPDGKQTIAEIMKDHSDKVLAKEAQAGEPGETFPTSAAAE